jgi:tetratricopeptide (TPR) repeat protein
MADIFLSYCQADIEVMLQVRGRLEGAGLSVWTDEDLEPGTINWQSEVERAIKEVLAMVIILSPEANSSEWLSHELTFSSMVGIPIYPLLARGEVKESVPLQLVTYQIVDIRGDVAQGINQLVKELRDIGLSRRQSKTAQTNKSRIISKRAEEHFFAQRYKEAIADALEALEIDPENVEALNVMANAHRMLGEWDKAVEEATRAIDLKRGNLTALLVRAGTFLSMGQGEKAIEDANRMLRSDSENIEALQIRTNAYMLVENYRQAIKDADKILEKESWNEAHLLMGEREKALDDATQAVQLDPDNEAAIRIERLARSQQFDKGD